MDTKSNASETPLLLAPVSGATLFGLEVERRKGLHQKGNIPTGCDEIDDTVLLGGGLERGCVVGVSAEEVDFGVLLCLQTIARALVFEHNPKGNPIPLRRECRPKAYIITTLPVTTVLPTLRDVIRSQVQLKLGPRNSGVDAELRRCLEAISISRVFDIEGLWEVLGELEAQAELNIRHKDSEEKETMSPHVPDENRQGVRVSGAGSATRSGVDENKDDEVAAETGDGEIQKQPNDLVPLRPDPGPMVSSSGPVTELPPLRIGPELRPLVRKSEILDSEDEEEFSSSPLSSLNSSEFDPRSPSPAAQHSQPPADQNSHPTPFPIPAADPESEIKTRKSESPASIFAEDPYLLVPDIIAVTHFSSLLTTLFTHRDKTSAHTSLQLLSSHLRSLARSAGPLIMLLNTTTSPATEASKSVSAAPKAFTDPNRPAIPTDLEATTQQQRPLDTTLRSIFNPGPQIHGHRIYRQGYGAAAANLTRRSKPSFGATFAQFLDLHLLCTKVPRTRDDAEAAIALGAGSEDVKYAWVVEVLLDELGIWEWENGQKEKRREEEIRLPPRVNREQRWGAVDVRDGVRVVNAFTSAGPDVGRGHTRLAAGFGGQRV
ncbi:hypothetical protein HD806DRAFT_379933 [Xylariaceae sp. AK1471]|nr:hypothetical protein HD806DRAFT_379933 [Xylariaceae sp. AK1471]